MAESPSLGPGLKLRELASFFLPSPSLQSCSSGRLDAFTPALQAVAQLLSELAFGRDGKQWSASTYLQANSIKYQGEKLSP